MPGRNFFTERVVECGNRLAREAVDAAIPEDGQIQVGQGHRQPDLISWFSGWQPYLWQGA